MNLWQQVEAARAGHLNKRAHLEGGIQELHVDAALIAKRQPCLGFAKRFFSFLALNTGGWLADNLIRRGFNKTWVRKTMQTLGFGGFAAVLSVVGYVESLPLAIALMSLGNIFGGAMAGGFGVNHLGIAPKGAGVIMGLSNTAGTIPGIIGVYVSGMILEATGSWALVFQTAAGVLLFGLVFYLVFASAEKQFD